MGAFLIAIGEGYMRQDLDYNPGPYIIKVKRGRIDRPPTLGPVGSNGHEIVWVGYQDEFKDAYRQQGWLNTSEGQKALREALEGDSRGECACGRLFAGLGIKP